MKTFRLFLHHARVFVVLLGLIALQAGPLTALAAGYLTLSSFSGTPGSVVHVSGGGLPANDAVRIYVGTITGSPVATATTNASGDFGADVTIPLNSPQGALSIIGVDASSTQLTNSYYVVPLNPSITVTAPSHAPFATVTVSGTGFGANESVTLELAGATAQATANASGAFSNATISVPAAPSNLYHLNVTGNQSGARAFEYFWVDALYPSVSPSAYYLLPGQTLTFTGSGFAANETVEIREQNTSTVLATLTTNASGGFTNAGGFALPASYHGSTRTFVLTGTTSHASASTGMTIGDFFPSVTPSVYWSLPGGPLSFSGSGFAANESVSVYRGTNTTALATFTTDANGSFTNKANIAAPYDAANGSVTYRFVGANSNATAQISISLGSYYPTISPSDYYVQPNANVLVTGSSFAPNETVTINVNGTSTMSTTTDATGHLSAMVKIPFSKSGSATINALGSVSQTQTSVTVTLATFYPSINPSAYYVFPADKITFGGTGFAPNETVTMTVRDGFGAVVASSTTATTNNSGAFSGVQLTVPFVSSASMNVTFTGSLSGANVVSQITVGARYAYIGSDNYYVTPGTTVHISGSGFAAGESVKVTAGTQSTAATADQTGSITNVAITIPFGSNGFINVEAVGQTSKTSAMTSITLAPFSPQVNPDTWYAAPGTRVTFTGTGFAPNETVSITKSSGGSQAVTTNGSGNFTVTATLPYGTGTNTATYTFKGSLTQQTITLPISLAQLFAGVVTSTYWAQGGSPITFTGSGFGANEQVAITFNGQAVTTVTANNSGGFSYSGTVPFAPAGNYTFTLTGQSSGAVATSPFTVAPVYAGVQLAQYASAPGTSITFIGSGYLPNEPINITTDRTGSTVVATFNADASGSFNTPAYTLPADFAEGNLQLTITGTHSFSTNSITYYVTGK